MPYSWLTFAQAKTQLANRLGDPLKIYWLDAELGEYLKESLRTFNSVAQLHRDRCIFPTQNGLAFYDLTQTTNPNSITGGTGSLATNPPALLGYSVTDRDLINLIQYHLIEPITTNWALSTPAMTEQFTMDDIVRAIERRRNQFLLLTALHQTHSQVAYGPPAGSGRIALSDSIIYIRRVSWLDLDGDFTPLWRDDEESGNFLRVDWANNPATPITYSAFMSPLVGLQLIPPSDDVGSVDLITINNPPNLDQTAGTLLSIPDDLAWIVKWGALSDLLGRDTQAYDPTRSQYCEQRWRDGIRFALALSTLQQVHINGLGIAPQSFEDFDALSPNWQNSSNNLPTSVAVAGRNLIALTPTPDSGVYAIQLDVVRNMFMPSSDASFLQISKDQFDVILDYSFHLAMFKDEGGEFEASIPMADNLLQMALQHNSVLKAEAKNFSVMDKYSKKEEIDRPRLQKEEEAA